MSEKPTYQELEQRIRELERAESERNTTEIAPRNLDGFFNPFFEKHDAVMLLIEPNSGMIINANIAAQNYYGYSIKTLKQMKIQDINILFPDEVGEKRHQAAIEECNYFEFPHCLASGEIRTVEVHSSPIIINGKKYLLSIIHDITERKQAKEDLLRKHEMLKRTEAIANVGSWEWEIETDTVIWSEELYRIFQLDPDGKAPNWAEHPKLYHPEDFKKLRQAAETAISDGKPYEIELRAFRKDGETRICVAKGFPETGEDGQVVRLFGLLQDITDRIGMESALKESEEKYRLLFENAEDAIFIADPETGMLLDANESAEQLTGYNRNELIGKHQTFIHPPEKSDYYGREFLKSSRDKDSKFKEMVVRKKNGHDIAVEIIQAEQSVVKTEVFMSVFSGTSLNEKKFSTRCLQVNLFFRVLYDNMTSGSAIYEVINDGSKGSDYIVKNFNKKSLEIEGKTLDQVVGKSLYDLRPTIDDYGLIPVMKKVWETGEPDYFPIKIYQDENFQITMKIIFSRFQPVKWLQSIMMLQTRKIQKLP
jgi:PAS domain S-box-containing protein